MKPKVVMLKDGVPALFISKAYALYHHPQRGVVYDVPCAMMFPVLPSKEPLAHVLAHLKACAAYSGAEPEAITALRSSMQLTKHEEIIIARASANLAQHVKREAAKSLPSKASAAKTMIAEGLPDEEIWIALRDTYVLAEKVKKKTLEMIAKQRSKPQKRTTKKGKKKC
jgi:hypothetical protein